MNEVLATIQGPDGTLLKVYDDNSISITSLPGISNGIIFSLDDFEAFVEYWNVHNPFKAGRP